MDEEAVKNWILYLLEEVRFLLNELVHYLIEKVERVWLVHPVIVRGVAYKDNLLKVLRLGQELEEGLVLAKFVKDLARVEGHMIVVAVFRRECIDEGVNNHNALFSEDFLHEPLVIGKLYLGLLRVDVKIVVVWVVPLVLLLRLDLLFDQLDE